ncbi:E3 ubiquitin-protein ligase RING1-like protein, partial [Mucuna pruriens]
MSTTFEVQEPTFSDDDIVVFNVFVATLELRNKSLLVDLDVPQTFLDGHDCDMVANFSKMLFDSILQSREVNLDYFCIFVNVFKGCCSYNIVNNKRFFHGEQVPSVELVQRMACQGGKHSLPTGATTLEKFKVQVHEKDNCVICLKEFNSSDDVAKLPCSHICHYNCILEWFGHRGTCPICRFACSDHVSHK